jgi:Tfp pilus assembly protein PilX
LEYNLKLSQKGFLLIIAMILVAIMAFVGLILTRLFANQTYTSTNLLLSKQALYMAVSGLEIAKRDLTQKAISCNNLGAQHAGPQNTGEAINNGQFLVTGVQSNPLTTLLSGSISNSSTSIQLANTAGFASSGIIKIDSEYIFYSSMSGNVLNNLSRGKAGSAASSHNSGAIVSQNQCYITSTGFITPDITKPGKKISSTVSSVVIMSSEMSLGGYQPSVSSGGSVSMSGNAYIANPGITLNGEGYTGSTLGIVGSNSLDISGNAGTKVENAAGSGLVTSTTRTNILTDIVRNVSTDPSLYYSYFGNYTPADLQAAATNDGNYINASISNFNAINGVTGEVIYINGNMNVTGNSQATIGTPTAPVVLYVNGSVNAGGTINLTVYGIVYVTGTINLSGNSSIQGEGSLATVGGLNMSGSTNIALTLESDDQVLSNLYSTTIPGAGTTSYTTQNLGIQQVYP